MKSDEESTINSEIYYKKYVNSFNRQIKTARDFFIEQAKNETGKKFSKMFLENLKNFYLANGKYCKNINRGQKFSLSYFIEDSFAELLRLELDGVDILVNSNVEGKRPDIQVKKGEKLIAIVELKSDLGWKRTEWHEKIEADVKGLEEKIGLKAINYYLVLVGGGNGIIKVRVKETLQEQLNKFKEIGEKSGMRKNNIYVLASKHPNHYAKKAIDKNKKCETFYDKELEEIILDDLGELILDIKNKVKRSN